MRRMLWPVLGFGFLAFVVHPLAAPQEPASTQQVLVLTANTTVGSRNGRSTIEFDIVNRTNEIVAAWRVTLRYRLSDGREKVSGLVKDSDDEVESPRSSNGRIPANGLIREFLLLPAGETPNIESIDANVDFAVFADETWLGDARGVQDIYDMRRREAESWSVIGDAMRLGRSVGGRAGLLRALDHLKRKDQSDYANPTKAIMRKNLQRAIDGSPSIRIQPAEFFRIWVERAEKHQKAAEGRLSPKGIRISR